MADEGYDHSTDSNDITQNGPATLTEEKESNDVIQADSTQLDAEENLEAVGKHSLELEEIRDILERTRIAAEDMENQKCETESEDSFTYVEPVPDPYYKAIAYLEKHSILQMFQKMTTNIVFKRPENPLDFMIEEIEDIKKARAETSDSKTKSET